MDSFHASKHASLSRRAFLATAGLGLAGAATDSWASTESRVAAAWHVPLDDVPHVRTWMAWPWDPAIWGDQLANVQDAIALVARTIAKYEPVILLTPSSADAVTAQSKCGSTVTVIPQTGYPLIPNNDFWMRDIAPVYRIDGNGGRDAIGLNFNGWGRKQKNNLDRRVAVQIAKFTGDSFQKTPFISEGGAIETDGDGTVMATESALVNRNRNPRKTKAKIEAAILAAYGAQKMIWVPGIRGQDITDDHIDSTSRFVRPGVVMVQVPPASRTDIFAEDERQQFQILSNATDAKGRQLEVIAMAGPDTVRSTSLDFVDSYVNYHVVNGAVIAPQFGDAAKDAACKATLHAAFPGRVVEQLNVDALGEGGGGIHCATMQEPGTP
ncbi:MAG: agmatine deiminase family protein [Planctomycetota bacterium]